MPGALALVTTNPAKYALFQAELDRLGVEIVAPPHPLIEIQSDDWGEIVGAKARTAARSLGRPCLVDDAGLVLDAYPDFPGPYTKSLLRSLGNDGLRRLLDGQAATGSLVAHLACSDGDTCLQWIGSVQGTLEFGEFRGGGPGPLHEWFAPSAPGPLAKSLHRLRAWRAMELDWSRLRDLGWAGSAEGDVLDCLHGSCWSSCPFCAELSGDPGSVYEKLVEGDPRNRVVHLSTSFVLVPPLGQFMEGGLLLLSRQHMKSLAFLNASQVVELEDLVSEVRATLRAAYGAYPVFFEHGPGHGRGKSTCCVDHAHLNIFPADVDLRPFLRHFPGHPVGSFAELAALRDRTDDYIFVQNGDGTRSVHFSEDFPSQMIRREITRQIDCPERWHWRDYLGVEELRATYNRLRGAFAAHAAF